MSTTYSLEHISNGDLLTSLKDLVGASNQLTSHLLAHLAEVEARGIYRELACSSMYTYCVYELRMSEDEAQRRLVVARTARRFPVIFEMLKTAAIHLTGIVLLAPHLTDENHAELLQRARFRTKSEIQKLIAQVAPKPDVPAKVEPLGPEPTRARATWRAFMEGLVGPVRNLPSGNGPGEAPAPPTTARIVAPTATAVAPAAHAPAREAECDTPMPAATQPLPSLLRYKVQFTADQRYVNLLNQARDLLQHEIVDRDICRVHARAMEALVQQLVRKRCAATRRPRSNRAAASSANDATTADDEHCIQSRYIRADVRRHVWERDGGQCTFVDSRGRRCQERAGLELHHREPYFRGGPASVENMTLYCRAHNALAAEQELGQSYVARRIEERQAARGQIGK